MTTEPGENRAAASHTQPDICPGDLKEARRYLACDDPVALLEFATRQLKSRHRTTRMLGFYLDHPCHMGRLHLLAGMAVMLGRFAGYSPSFDQMGDAFMPVDAGGKPRTGAWKNYASACADRMAWEVRDELWLAAHMQDMQSMKQAGLQAAFYAEDRDHERNLTWRLLKQHMEVTIGARLMDTAALSGAIAYETAMAHGLRVGGTRLVTEGISLLAYYAGQAARASLLPSGEPRRPLLSYRRAALNLARYSVTAWTASRVFRRGMRQRERGRLAGEEGWPLLEQVLGDRVGEVDPAIVRFYTNPSGHSVKASISLFTMPARFWSRFATILIGQGLYETGMEEIDAEFRVFRRADGSMHFLRQLYCRGVRRVFDSDFIVETVDGRPTFFEVFVDLKVEVEMEVTPLEGGGLSIRGRNIYFRGIKMPRLGLQVEFQSHTRRGSGSPVIIQIDGNLTMEPRSSLGRFIAQKILRRPRLLASIRYTAIPVEG